MIGLVCAVLSGLGYYFCIGIGEQWWLIWIAPIPLLWFAFGPASGRAVFLTAFAAMALGSCSWLRAYWSTMPVPVLIEALLGPSLLFALAVTIGRRVQRRVGVIAGALAFALAWCAADFLTAFNRGGGSVQSPAAALVGAPVLMQAAALFGFPALTFLIGFVPAGIAASLRSRSKAPAALALAVFVLNLGFGYWRMSAPAESTFKVALLESDAIIGKIRADDEAAALKAIDAYAAAAQPLRAAHVQLIVLPENIARLALPWRSEAEAKLAALSRETQATLVAGFNTPVDGALRNVSLAFMPERSDPVMYVKRRLVPVLETQWYSPGDGPKALDNGVGLEVCKDMDFHAMLRKDMTATHPRLLAVPAWDFDRDDWSHARVAILRSVENGVPLARSARDGLLTLNDRYGRLVSKTRTSAGFTLLVGELPLAGRGGETFYDRIGDAFGWGALFGAAALLGASFIVRGTRTQARAERADSI